MCKIYYTPLNFQIYDRELIEIIRGTTGGATLAPLDY